MIGSTISHYRVLEALGEGGMGVVYLAEDVRLERKVVLKFLHPHRSRDAEAKLRFSQEARAASSLNLPNICTIYDIGDTDHGGMFIAMAHYAGETLKARLERGVIPVGEAVRICCQLARGLDAAHKQGIVHRDVKPANILLAADGRAIILDFGIAKLVGNEVLTRSDVMLGTIAYMSPEQAQAMEVGPPSDVWSLGVVLYEMLASERPFDRAYDHAILYAIINEEAPDVRSIAEDVPAPVAGFIRDCLSKSPEDRPLLGDGLLERLAASHIGHGVDGVNVPAPEVAVRAHSRDGTAASAPATVTLFFSDLEGSTRLLETLGGSYGDLLQNVRNIIREKLRAYGGEEIDTAGDGLFACFASAGDAARAAIDIQRLITSREWVANARVKLRIGLHTGEPVRRGDTLVGMDVHRAARICAAAHGGQILVSSATERLLALTDLNGASLADLGEYRLKDISAPERLFQVMASGLPAGIHRPRADGMGGELPVPLTELVGREAELEDIDRIIDSDIRIITLTGPGGTGKTRLAIEAARRAAHRFESGARFVGLAPISDSEMLLPSISRTLGIPDNPDRSVREALLEYLKPRSILLVLDNFEQLVDNATIVGDLLSEAGRVTAIVTSRIPLRIGGEREYRVPTLAFPDGSGDRSAEVTRYPSVTLFVDRARIVRPDFTLAGNEKAVAEICARVDGLPLAIELAAARSRLFTPQQLLHRLNSSLDVLRTKGRDVPDRHQTLRGAIAWSYDLLEASEKELFNQLAVFSRGWTLEAATAVCISSK
ncbi:MAG: protein kinase, partial [Rhodothermia bacterium]|nr:protein kinase [Rhodothermia bacterium]